MRLAVDHLSCYALTYEPNTALGVRKRLGRVQAVAEESEREMFDATARFLQGHDLHRYEVSNFARIGYESRHNLAYWRGENYLGLGPSAASHVDGTRWRNTPHLGRWESGVDNARLNVIDYESLDARARAAEMIWLGLRTREGVDVAATGERTGADVLRHHGETIRALSDGGLLVAGSGRIRLHPDAWHLADGVAAEFLVD
jgi:oxygen-independent coproporphyrinogen-3 oxidase